MESPGQYLKRERELRGISLSKVHEVTRVQRKYLEAIESDNYDNLPSPAFVKGFIKSYCKHLGLDEDDAVLRYEVYIRDRTADRPGAGTEAPSGRPHGEAPDVISGIRPSGSRNIILYLVAAGFAIIILFYLLSSWRGAEVEPVRSALDAPEEVEKPADSAASVVEAPEKPAPAEAEPAVVQAKPPEKAPAVKAAPAREAKPAAAASAKKHRLTIEATETSWVEVRIDGDEPFDVMLRQGEKLSWLADDKIALVIGNAGGVSLEFDGKRLEPLGPSGNVARVELTGEGITKKVSAPKPSPEEEPAPSLEDKEPGATVDSPTGKRRPGVPDTPTAGAVDAAVPAPPAAKREPGAAPPAAEQEQGVAAGRWTDKIKNSLGLDGSDDTEAAGSGESGDAAGPASEAPEDGDEGKVERKPFELDWQ